MRALIGLRTLDSHCFVRVINENVSLLILLSIYTAWLLGKVTCPTHVSRWYDRVEMQELASPELLEYIVAD